MKRILSLLAALALCLCLIVPAAAADSPAGAADAASAGLKFKNGAFKIIHVSDTQEFLLSSPITQEFLYELAEKEKPDLFILTGDNTSTGGASGFPAFIAKLLVKSGVDSLMRVFDRIYKDFGIPMTMVFGNHDNEVGPDKVTRAEHFAMYAAHPSFIGYYVEAADKGTGKDDEQGDHYGTHNILVKNSAGTAPAFNLWMFDTGSYDPAGGYSCVQPQQIAWFEAENAKTGNLPSFAFQHIIVPEIYDELTPGAEGAENTFTRDFVIGGANVKKTISSTLPTGVKGTLREAPCPGQHNQGQYAALSSANVLAMFFGHDHVNTFELELDGKPDLVNSPCSGFGSYGDIDLRGVRVIDLKEDMTYTSKVFTYQTYYSYTPNVLRDTRLAMYQEIGAAAQILDWFSFSPLFWLMGLLKLA